MASDKTSAGPAAVAASDVKLPEEVVTHPLVLLSIVDHYNRVAKDTSKRVVGVLLGSTFQGKCDITNSFAVPFDEDLRNPGIWYLDHDFLENMYHMFKKINGASALHGRPSTWAYGRLMGFMLQPRSASSGSTARVQRSASRTWRSTSSSVATARTRCS